MIEMRELIRSLKKDHTVILSSHILSEVSAVCDQILIISKGELVASDTPDGLQAKLKGAGELELCVKGTAAQLKTLLSNLDGVESFTTTEAEDGTVLAQVSEKADCDIRGSRCFMSWQRIGCPCLAWRKRRDRWRISSCS